MISITIWNSEALLRRKKGLSELFSFRNNEIISMKSRKEELPKQADDSEKLIRELQMGDMNVGYETFQKEVDLQPILNGLPDNNCKSRHWGYVLKGGFEVKYSDHTEVCREGDLYYMAPGHVARIFAGTELVEFSPRQEEEKMRDAIRKNLSK